MMRESFVFPLGWVARCYLSIPVKDTATFISVAKTQPFLTHHPKKCVAGLFPS